MFSRTKSILLFKNFFDQIIFLARHKVRHFFPWNKSLFHFLKIHLFALYFLKSKTFFQRWSRWSLSQTFQKVIRGQTIGAKRSKWWSFCPSEMQTFLHCNERFLCSCCTPEASHRQAKLQLLQPNHFLRSGKDEDDCGMNAVQSGACGNLPHTCQGEGGAHSKQKLLNTQSECRTPTLSNLTQHSVRAAVVLAHKQCPSLEFMLGFKQTIRFSTKVK